MSEILIIISNLLFSISSIGAQSSLDIEVVDGLSLNIPTFFSLEQIRNYSVLSYVAFAVNMVFIVIVLIWVFRIIRAAVEYIKSEGNEETIKNSNEKLSNIFAGIGVLFGFFIILILVSAFFNVGSFLSWPKYLSYCTDGSLYIAKTLEVNPNGERSEGYVDDLCFNGGGFNLDQCYADCPSGNLNCRESCIDRFRDN